MTPSKELSRDFDVSHSRDLIPGLFCRFVSESLVLGTFSGFFEGHVRQAIEYLTTLVSDCDWISFGTITRLGDTSPKAPYKSLHGPSLLSNGYSCTF